MKGTKKGTPTPEEIIEVIKQLNGRATLEEAMALFKKKGFSFDKTKTWDRLVMLSRKDIVKNESGTWILPEMT